MTLEERVDSLEARLGKNDELVRELRDAVLVTTELESRQARAMKDLALETAAHGDWLRDHKDWLREHKEAIREHEEAMRNLDRRIAGLASGFGEFISRFGQQH
jgi:uncharacterized coiled-coil protein SlyX